MHKANSIRLDIFTPEVNKFDYPRQKSKTNILGLELTLNIQYFFVTSTEMRQREGNYHYLFYFISLARIAENFYLKIYIYLSYALAKGGGGWV